MIGAPNALNSPGTAERFVFPLIVNNKTKKAALQSDHWKAACL